MTATALTRQKKIVMIWRIVSEAHPYFGREVSRRDEIKNPTTAFPSTQPGLNALAQFASNKTDQTPAKTAPLMSDEAFDSANNYFNEIRSLSDQELSYLYLPLREADDNAKAAKAEAEDNARWPIADLELWGSCDVWTLQEGMALLVGREPDAMTYPKVRESEELKIKSDAARAYMRVARVAKASIHGFNLDEEEEGDFAQQDPTEFLGWAVEKDIPIPPDLALAVARYSERKSYADLEFEVLVNEDLIEAQAADIERLTLLVESKEAANSDTTVNTQTLTAREKKTIEVGEQLITDFNTLHARYDDLWSRSNAFIVGELLKRGDTTLGEQALAKLVGRRYPPINAAIEKGHIQDFLRPMLN